MRPFVIFPAAPICLEPVDIVPGHRDSEYGHGLKESGSYPSGHTFRGMLWGMLLAEMLPERADALLERCIQFGESRVLCGFHFASRIGRITALSADIEPRCS